MSVPSIQVTDVKPSISSFGLPPKEPEEELRVAPTLDQSKVWALKIPRFLLERWERVNQEGVHLATLVVDNSQQPPRISLKLPETTTATPPVAGPSAPRRQYDTNGIPDEYEVSMPSERVRNTYVFTEKRRTWVGQAGESGHMKRKREKAEPTLLAALDHEGSVRPTKSAKYLKILEQRRLDAEQSKRPIVQIDNTNTSAGMQAQLASGFHNASSSFGQGMLAPRTASNGDRFERMDRHVLLDRIFALFTEKPYWSITALRATLKQPDVYLREVLKDVAVLIKDGTYANMWELKEGWRDGKPAKGELDGDDELLAADDAGLDDEDEDEEFEDDEDMEEVGM